jgi:hypothetical protein
MDRDSVVRPISRLLPEYIYIGTVGLQTMIAILPEERSKSKLCPLRNNYAMFMNSASRSVREYEDANCDTTLPSACNLEFVRI